MLGVLWYFVTFHIGYLWITRSPAFRNFLSFGEALAAAVVVGTIGGSWLVYLCACLSSVLSESTILAATLLGYGFAWWRSPASIAAGDDLPPPRASSPVPPTSGKSSGTTVDFSAKKQLRFTGDDKVALLFVLFLSFWMWPMYSHRMIPQDQYGQIVTGASCYGDLPIHMTIANSFLVGVNMEIKWGKMISPIFAGEYMTYPFLPDFHAAILVRLGESMRTGFLIPGFMMSTALWALLYFFAVRVTRSRLGSLLAVFLTMFAGGMGGWRWAQQHGWNVAFERDVVQHDPSGEWKFLWFAFIPHILLPQRGGNFAYPMVMLVLLTMWRATDASVKMPAHQRASLLIHAALFAASLPMVQAHSFIGVGIIIGVFFVLDAHKWLRDGKLFIGWGLAGVVALLLSLPQMTQFTKTVSAGFYGKFMTYGWLFHNYEFGEPYGIIGFFNFWWNSLGPAVYLFVAGCLLYSVESVQAWRMARRLVKDNGSGAIARYLQSLATTLGDSDSIYVNAAPDKLTDPYDQPALLSSRTVLEMLYQRIGLPLYETCFAGILRHNRLVDFDTSVSSMNALSVNGRALDTIKLGVGAFGVFLLGNYVNLQPWDRDNAKIYYVFIFVASTISGALLCAPLEYLVGLQPGTRRVSEWVGALFAAVGQDVDNNTRAAKESKITKLRKPTEYGISIALLILAPILAFFCMLSGYILFQQEFRGNGVMLDLETQEMGQYILENVPPKAVIMHSNYHVQPSSAIAGRPSLVSYYGWVSNHGYNSHERLGDRDYVMDNALKDSDEHAYNLCRKWGVRYIVGENMRTHQRAQESDLYLDGKLRKVHQVGRFILLEVLGY